MCPIEGEVKRAKEIGYCGRALHIWVICPECRRGRWVVLGYTKQAEYTGLCSRCKAKIAQYIDGRSIPIEVACHDCGKTMRVAQKRFVQEEYTPLCASCRGKRRVGNKSRLWKGGRSKYKDGYIYVWLPRSSPFYPMTHHSSVKEHRLVMAQRLGRCLFPWEIVHHINAIKDDNRPENLELLPTHREHRAYTSLQERIRTLEQRVTYLEAEVALKEDENADKRNF